MSIAFVQESHNGVLGTSLSVSISSSGTGNLLIALLGYSFSGATVTTVTDNAGNTYHKAASGSGNDGIWAVETWYAFNSISGATSVSISTTVGSRLTASVQEFSGVQTASSPLDSAGALFGVGQNDVGPSLTPSVSGELLVSFIISTNETSFGVQSPWTGFSNSVATGSGVAYYINPPVSAQQAQFTPVANINYGSSGAVFLPKTTLTLSLSESLTESDTKKYTDSTTRSDSISQVDILQFFELHSFGTLKESTFLSDFISTSPILASFNENIRTDIWNNLQFMSPNAWTSSDINNPQ